MDKVNSFPGFINLDVTAFLWEDVVFILFCDLLACLRFHQNQIFCFKSCRFACKYCMHMPHKLLTTLVGLFSFELHWKP